MRGGTLICHLPFSHCCDDAVDAPDGCFLPLKNPLLDNLEVDASPGLNVHIFLPIKPGPCRILDQSHIVIQENVILNGISPALSVLLFVC